MSDVIGTSVRRPDVQGKVTGAARYAGDLHLQGMLHAKIKRSTVAHANIRRLTRHIRRCEISPAPVTHCYGVPEPEGGECAG